MSASWRSAPLRFPISPSITTGHGSRPLSSRVSSPPPIGALLAIPAIRFPGLYLALATLGFGLLLQQMFYAQSYMFGTFGLGISVPRPHLSWLNLSSDNGYYYLVLAIAIAVTGLVVMINRSRLGRLLRAMADSPAGLGACGASINVTRVLVFCLSASLRRSRDLGRRDAWRRWCGRLPAADVGAAVRIDPLTVGRAPWYALIAAALQVLLPAYLSTGATVGYAMTTIFGLVAIVFSVTPASSRELPLAVRDAIDRLVPRLGLPRWFDRTDSLTTGTSEDEHSMSTNLVPVMPNAGTGTECDRRIGALWRGHGGE